MFERYLQIKQLKESNSELVCLIQNAKKIQVLDATLTIQNEHLPEIVSHMPLV